MFRCCIGTYWTKDLDCSIYMIRFKFLNKCTNIWDQYIKEQVNKIMVQIIRHMNIWYYLINDVFFIVIKKYTFNNIAKLIHSYDNVTLLIQPIFHSCHKNTF